MGSWKVLLKNAALQKRLAKLFIHPVPLVVIATIFATLVGVRLSASAAETVLTELQQEAIATVVTAEEAGNLNQCRAAQVDLEGDGTNETVIIFRVGSHGSQGRMFDWDSGSPSMVFDAGSNTPNTDFCLLDGVPTFALEQTARIGGEVSRLTYQWRWRSFELVEGVECPAEPTVVWGPCEDTPDLRLSELDGPFAPDGHHWLRYSAERKLSSLQDLFEMLRELGVTVNYDPLYYIGQLNAYYSNPSRLNFHLGDALYDVIQPQEVTMADE